MKTIDQLVRPHILDMQAYSSARSEFKATAEILLDANELPYGEWNRYPDPLQNELRNLISDQKNIGIDNIFLGNGSDEIIDLLIRMCCEPARDTIAIFTPTYGMYKVCAALNNIEVNVYPLDENFQVKEDDAQKIIQDKNCKIIFLCSPNNPTGNDITIPEVFIKDFKGLLVIDEAYIDFSLKASMINSLENNPRMLILQTLSKAHGLAGARIGVAFANPYLVSLLQKIKPPYNISGPNQAIALTILKDVTQYRNNLDSIQTEKKILLGALENLSCVVKIFPSAANFILVQMTDATDIYIYLVKKNIIVRNRQTEVYNCLRISVGTPKENSELLQALKKYTND